MNKPAKTRRASPWQKVRRRRNSQFPEKKEAVLQAAAALFRDRGYDAASLNDLADILNITKPTVYYYVHSKQQLLLDILKRAQDQILGHLEEVERSNATAYEKLRTFMIHYALIMISDYGACLARFPWRTFDARSRADIQARIDEADEMLYRIIAAGEKDKTLSVPDRVVVYHALFGSLNWMAYWTKSSGRHPPQKLAEMQVDVLLSGIRGAAAPTKSAKTKAALSA